jgi:histidyl-tRNA synthetase
MDMSDDTHKPADLKLLGNVRGTEYVYPERMQQINALTKTLFDAAKTWGYAQIDGPTLQPVEFYSVKSSDELLKDGYYVSAGSHTYMLRPEITPTIAYMLAEAEKSLTYPVRWFSDPQVYRNERPQSGRRRQFGQFNLDRFDLGPLSVEARAAADAEVISEAIDSLIGYGLTKEDIAIRINSRSMLEKTFSTIGIDDKDVRSKLLTVIDAKEKVSEEDFLQKTIEAGVTPEQSNDLLYWFTLLSLSSIESDTMFNAVAKSDEYKELCLVLELIGHYGYSDYVRYDPVIVRGLGYYTGTVFEAFDRQPERSMSRSILGGGRYDNFTSKFGGKLDVTGVGYGMGHVPLEAVLASRDILAQSAIASPAYYITIEEDIEKDRLAIIGDIYRVVMAIRATGKSVIMDASITTLAQGRLKKQLSNAGKSGAQSVLIFLGDRSKGIALKDFNSGQQTETGVDAFIDSLS